MIKYLITQEKSIYKIYESDRLRFIIKTGLKYFTDYSEVYDGSSNLLVTIKSIYSLFCRRGHVFCFEGGQTCKLSRIKGFFSINYLNKNYSLKIPLLGAGTDFYLNNKLTEKIAVVKSSFEDCIYEIEAECELEVFIFSLIFITREPSPAYKI